jgi:DNA-binding transcriptional LysR family regulator
MAQQIDWERWLGRRLRLQDLRVFLSVVQHGSMAKAAAQLGVTQPAVSKVIADLEHSLAVRLFDRSPQGVQPTIYGRALIKRSTAAFYELKQSVLEIGFLADPTQGELRVGSTDAVSASILPPIMYSFSQRYPRVVLYVSDNPAPRREIPALRDGKHDLVLGRLASSVDHDFADDDLDVEFLFDDGLVLATGKQNPWARRRRIDLAELIDEPWILPGPDSWVYTSLMETFKSRGLDMPKITLMATSVPLRAHFLHLGPYIATFARGNLLPIADQYGFKVLNVDVPTQPASMAIITLKGRTLSPVAKRFIEHVRKFTQPMRSGPK